MTIATYNTDDELKQFVFPSGYSSDTIDDALFTTANQAACRVIDGFCNQRFWLDPTPVARTFVPNSLLELEFDDDPLCPGIGDSTSVTVACDAAGDGTYEQVWSASDFQLLPQNAPYASAEPEPWTSIRAVGTKTFPWLVNTWLTRLNRVQVTAKWGWPAVPYSVKMAALIQGAKFYKRRDALMAISVETGMYLGHSIDPDVALLLSKGRYRKNAVLVA